VRVTEKISARTRGEARGSVSGSGADRGGLPSLLFYFISLQPLFGLPGKEHGGHSRGKQISAQGVTAAGQKTGKAPCGRSAEPRSTSEEDLWLGARPRRRRSSPSVMLRAGP